MLDVFTDPVVFSWLTGALLLFGFLIGLPAVTTALGMIGLERGLNKLFRKFASALARRSHSLKGISGKRITYRPVNAAAQGPTRGRH